MSDPGSGIKTNPRALTAIIKASESHNIVASQDIVDVRGMKLWARGQPVSAALQQRLLERRLQKPLEACLVAEDGITAFKLRDALELLLDDGSALALVLAPWREGLLAQMQHLPLHSVAQLLLTVGSAVKPSVLPHAVGALALAGALMSSRQATAFDIRMAMLGGLLHDVGEVYIQPEYLDCSRQLDLVAYKHLAVHPRISQMLFSSTTDYPVGLCRALGEHHERLDGTGYPAQLTGTGFSRLGRLLSVVEVAMGVFRQPRAPLTRLSFALRVVPGEFDPEWIGLLCDTARLSAEPAATARSAAQLQAAYHASIQHLEALEQIAADLALRTGTGAVADVGKRVLYRLTRIRLAWNAIGFWGVRGDGPSLEDGIELELACHELNLRMREAQREALILSEQLPRELAALCAPLWQDKDAAFTAAGDAAGS